MSDLLKEADAIIARNEAYEAQATQTARPVEAHPPTITNSMAQGIVLGLMLAAAAIVITLSRKLWANQSEGARRLKLVIKIGVALLIGAAFVSGGTEGIISAAVIGVIYWIYKGFKKG